MLGAAGLAAAQVEAQMRTTHELAGEGARIGVNFLMPFLDLEALEAAAGVAALVECFYGDPDPMVVDRVHHSGALAAWQVGSLEEARAAIDAGCDVVVVQGREAGGHVRGTSPLLPLLNDVRSALDVPVIAAGGIGSGAAIARVLAAGADAVRIGTRLVATPEADVHPDYAAALVAAQAGDTVLTEAFSEGWPNAPHRVLRACVDAGQAEFSARSPLPPSRSFVGDTAAAALYAGESVGDVTAVLPAAQVIRELVRDAESFLRTGSVDG
jgi:NAD(P)H-dependent flavin oxidoreductase YrpB (nitropropane dioxygenase family)